MKTILLSNHYDEAPLDILLKTIPEGFQLQMLENVSQTELIEKAYMADYLLVSGRLKINEAVLKNATNLKMIQRTGVGLDVLDMNAIKEREIPLYVNYGVNSNSVAEYALLLILSSLRKVCVVNELTKNGVWIKQKTGIQTHELCGKRIGIVGMGKIGQRLVQLLGGFGVEIVYYDKYRLSNECEERLKIKYCTLNDLLSSVDILSLHCALTEETKYLVNKNTLKIMKKGLVLVNTARGELICENDLEMALENGIVSCAALDVFEEEPVSSEHPLLKREDVISTSHIGGITYESFYHMMQDAVNNIELFEQGKYKEIEKYRYSIEV